MTRPTQSFALRWRKNEPWLQSCWIMNRRTRKPAAGTAISSATQSDHVHVAQASAHIAINGTTVITISKMLLAVFGSR